MWFFTSAGLRDSVDIRDFAIQILLEKDDPTAEIDVTQDKDDPKVASNRACLCGHLGEILHHKQVCAYSLIAEIQARDIDLSVFLKLMFLARFLGWSPFKLKLFTLGVILFSFKMLAKELEPFSTLKRGVYLCVCAGWGNTTFCKRDSVFLLWNNDQPGAGTSWRTVPTGAWQAFCSVTEPWEKWSWKGPTISLAYFPC